MVEELAREAAGDPIIYPLDREVVIDVAGALKGAKYRSADQYISISENSASVMSTATTGQHPAGTGQHGRRELSSLVFSMYKSRRVQKFHIGTLMSCAIHLNLKLEPHEASWTR